MCPESLHYAHWDPCSVSLCRKWCTALSDGTHFAAHAQISSGKVTELGVPRQYIQFVPSPDGCFILVSWLERPFSHTVPHYAFPQRTQLWHRCAPAAAVPLIVKPSIQTVVYQLLGWLCPSSSSLLPCIFVSLHLTSPVSLRGFYACVRSTL